MREGDIVYCKRATTKKAISKPDNSVIVFKVGDKCTIESLYYLGNMMILLTENGTIVHFLAEHFHDHFETLSEHRKRMIDNLL